MTPNQVMRVDLGDIEVVVGLHRLPYIGGRDAFATPGGFFTTSDGEIGVMVDRRLMPEEAEEQVRRELKQNLPLLREAARQQQQRRRDDVARASMS